ncbi:gluconokinase [Corynebacterium occultum]|nr:gluconokinase [Corynebacterium occultum]
MGVSGSGKTTTGQLLSEELGVPYADGDDLHPRANIDKMASGQALNDEDRWPWLELIGRWLSDHPEGGIIGCSALRRSYRDLIRTFVPGVRFVHVHGTREVLWERMSHREGHFMPPELLDSQFATLEELAPEEAGEVFDISLPPEEIVAEAATWLRS